MTAREILLRQRSVADQNDVKGEVMLKTASLGYPRIGERRELKKATESYWKKEITKEELERLAGEIRRKNWRTQKEAGIDIIPSNDFSFYDAMLDMTALLGAVPPRYGWKGREVDLDTYFAMARGSADGERSRTTAMEMTKWFDTNYHYLVPEFYKKQAFQQASRKPFQEFKEARSLGIETRPVLIGPVTYLSLGKAKESGFSVWSHLEGLLGVYAAVLKEFEKLGAEWVQMDEPILVTNLDSNQKAAFQKAYRLFAKEAPDVSILLAAYFGKLGANRGLAAKLPVAGIHLDWVRGADEPFSNKKASLGVVDGRNVWKSDLNRIIRKLKPVLKSLGAENCEIAPSSSLMFSPLDLNLEAALDPQIKRWLCFARQRLDELQAIRQALSGSERSVAKILKQNQSDITSRAQSLKIHKKEVAARLRALKRRDFSRQSLFTKRQKLQKERFGFPLLPTTTIGSFPQTTDVRKARADFKKGVLSAADYEAFLKTKTKECVRRQEELGLDVLVHGEFERNDMVEYFGERLEGFVFTRSGWVQSYGTRTVKPPILYGDVRRAKPMTVSWTRYAQGLTKKPVKGMLTGPITILQWSFVRNDQPRSRTAKQIALAIRDEVSDLEKAGVSIIQIDEPAIREGLPLRKEEWAAYLKWAVDAFRLASSCVKDRTQIHTHMCYSEFNDIIRPIAKMDADVISIETSRSQMELLDAFVKFHYPNEIGPGVYDIHSPRVPSKDEMQRLLEKAGSLLPARNLWVNPDCGLKTRGWEETIASLQNMVQAAKALRGRYSLNGHRGPAVPSNASIIPQ